MDDQKLFEAAVESMLATLDPYTEFEGEQLAQDMREVREGGREGVREGGRGRWVSRRIDAGHPGPLHRI